MTSIYPWDAENQFQKSKSYLDNAEAAGRGSPAFAVWTGLALEHLLRAAINTVHPALGVETKDEPAFLSVFNVGEVKVYKTLPIGTVIRRLSQIFPEFNTDLANHSSRITDQRNAELHSAMSGFGNDNEVDRWLPDFYRVCDVLVTTMGKTLDDLLGADGVVSAREFISRRDTDITKAAHEKKRLAKAAFEVLSPPDQELRRTGSAHHVATILKYMLVGDKKISLPGFADIPVGLSETTCPSCNAPVILRSTIITSTIPAVDEDGMIATTYSMLPTSLTCTSCGLKLSQHAELSSLGIGDTFIKVERQHHGEFFFDPYENYDPYDDIDDRD